MKSLVLFSALIVIPSVSLAAEDLGKPLLALDAGGHTGRVWDVVFAPGGRELISVSYDKTIRIWDLTQRRADRTLRPPIGPGIEGRLICAALSPDGQTLATAGKGVAGRENAIYLISLASGEIIRVLQGHSAPINTVAFSPDGKRLGSASNDRTARIWDLASGVCLHVLAGHEHDNVNCVAFSSDGQLVGTASADMTARLWSVETGGSQSVLRHKWRVAWIAFAPDRATVATAGGTCLSIWNSDGTRRDEYNGEKEVFFCQFAADSRKVFVVGAAPYLLDLRSRETRDFSSPGDRITGGALSPDGSRAVTVDATGNLYCWRTEGDNQFQPLSASSTPVRSVAFSADGKSIAFGEPDRPQRSFSVTELELGQVAGEEFRLSTSLPSGISLTHVEAEATTVSVWREGKNVAVFKAPDMRTGDQRASCSAVLNTNQGVVGNGNGCLYLFDLSSGTLQREFRGHVGEVWAVASSPDGRYLVSGSNDHTIRIWTLNAEEPLLSLLFARDDWIAWTPEGYYACSPGGEKLMGWHVNNGPDKMATFYPAAQFRDSLYRPDVIKRLLEAGNVEEALARADAERGTRTTKVEVSDVLPPFVMITSPDQRKLESAESTIELRFAAKAVGKHGITGVRLLLNGRPYPRSEHSMKFNPPEMGDVKGAWSVKLEAGLHSLAVQVESSVSKAKSEPVEVVYGARGLVRASTADGAAQKELQSILYVLAIGVSEYPTGPKLKYAAKDAEAIAQTYSKYSAALFKKVEVKLLTDEQATQRNIMRGLTWLRRQMTQNDVGVISFAGHGDKDLDGAFYLLPIDVDSDDLFATGVSGDQLTRALADTRGRFIVLLDACHSGAVDRDRRRARDSLTDDLARELVTDNYGAFVMCSATGKESAFESPRYQHGFFTFALIEGLKGKADYIKDGVIDLHEINLYVANQVKELSGGQQHPVTAQPASIRSFPLTKHN